MARITFTSNLQRHLDCPSVPADGRTVREALDAVFAANPRLRSYLLDDQGRLRRHVIVFIGDRPLADPHGLTDPIAPDAELYVFQALSGGRR